MTDDKFFDNARDLFLMDGWKEFTKELEVMASSFTFDGCSSSDEFWRSKGALESIRRIQAYEDMVKQAEGEAQ
jgi:hypothetical protein